MLWQGWLESVAPSIGCTTEQAGIILSLLITLAFSIACMMATPKNALASGTLGFITGIIIFVYAEWFPVWTGTAIAVIVSLIIAGMVSGRI